MSKQKKENNRLKRNRNRSKRTARNHPTRLRLCVYRSNNNIEAQIIDDAKGVTLVSASSLDKELRSQIAEVGSKVEQSKIVGAALAKRALKKKILKVVFDRNGFVYHGRIKALADTTREGGITF